MERDGRWISGKGKGWKGRAWLRWQGATQPHGEKEDHPDHQTQARPWRYSCILQPGNGTAGKIALVNQCQENGLEDHPKQEWLLLALGRSWHHKRSFGKPGITTQTPANGGCIHQRLNSLVCGLQLVEIPTMNYSSLPHIPTGLIADESSPRSDKRWSITIGL